MRILFIINKLSGPDNPAWDELIGKSLKGYNVKYDIEYAEGSEIVPTIKKHDLSGYDVVAATGGDGTIGSIAELVIDKNCAFGIIPGGTYNHFAKDTGIPVDYEEAVKNLVKGEAVYVDAAEVNGKIFVNNSSVGLYPRAVRMRENFTQKLGGGKKFVMLYSLFTMIFKKFPLYSFEVDTEKGCEKITSPFVFVGNNKYFFDLFNFWRRSRLDEGLLTLYTTNIQRKRDIFKLAFLTLFNLKPAMNEFRLDHVQEVKLHINKTMVKIAADGEVLTMKPPLHYKILPKKLKVILPKNRENN